MKLGPYAQQILPEKEGFLFWSRRAIFFGCGYDNCRWRVVWPWLREPHLEIFRGLHPDFYPGVVQTRRYFRLLIASVSVYSNKETPHV